MVERNLVGHVLNTDPEQWDLIRDGLKHFEVRLDDRDYQVGDHLDLRRASRKDVDELRVLSKIQASALELKPAARTRLEELVDCPRQRCWITSKVRLSGPIVPAEPHWWKVSAAMEHGVVVLGIEREVPSRAAAGSADAHRKKGCTCPLPYGPADDCPVHSQ